MRSWFVPPRCAVCAQLVGGPPLLCTGCREALEHLGPVLAVRGSLRIAAAHRYEGVARDLLASIKLSGRIPLAPEAAARIASRALPLIGAVGEEEAAIVPVPADPWRRAMRGFDLPLMLAREVARLERREVRACLRRRRGARQVGRSRAERLGDPPRVSIAREPPPVAVLLDDVATTGATLSACAAALEGAGVRIAGAITFAAVP